MWSLFIFGRNCKEPPFCPCCFEISQCKTVLQLFVAGASDSSVLRFCERNQLLPLDVPSSSDCLCHRCSLILGAALSKTCLLWWLISRGDWWAPMDSRNLRPYSYNVVQVYTLHSAGLKMSKSTPSAMYDSTWSRDRVTWSSELQEMCIHPQEQRRKRERFFINACCYHLAT